MTTNEEIEDFINYFNRRGIPIMRYSEYCSTPESIKMLEMDIEHSEALLVLREQKHMMESNISDLIQRRGEEEIAKLKKRIQKEKDSLRRSKLAQKRRKEMEQKRKQFRKRNCG